MFFNCFFLCRQVDEKADKRVPFCKFMSGYTSAAGSMGTLVQLATETTGKMKRLPNFMSYSGRVSQPVPASDIYEVYQQMTISFTKLFGAAGDHFSGLFKIPKLTHLTETIPTST